MRRPAMVLTGLQPFLKLLSGNAALFERGGGLMFSRAIAFAFLLITANTASATLIAVMSGTAGDGETTISFNGSSIVAAGASRFSGQDTGSDAGAWFDFGDYIVSINNTYFDVIAGTGSVGVNGTFVPIDMIYLDEDSDDLDDWGVRLDGFDLSIVAGDLVEWSGTVTIGVDFGEFIVGTYSSNLIRHFLDGEAELEVILQIGSTAVPEPDLVGLFGLGFLGMWLSMRGRI